MTRNLTDFAWVKLTPAGRDYARGFFKEAFASHERQDGWFECTFGDLVRGFGALIHGGEIPFQNNEVHFVRPF